MLLPKSTLSKSSATGSTRDGPKGSAVANGLSAFGFPSIAASAYGQGPQVLLRLATKPVEAYAAQRPYGIPETEDSPQGGTAGGFRVCFVSVRGNVERCGSDSADRGPGANAFQCADDEGINSERVAFAG